MFNIRPEIADFFKPFFQSGADGAIIFNYGQTAFERWTPGAHIVPCTQEIWLAGAAYPGLITDLYIGYSAADLISFTSQRAYHLLRHAEQQAFAALGLLPRAKQVWFLKSLFPYARWHLLFNADLLGKIGDASVAVWYKGDRVAFRVDDRQVKAKYRSKAFYFDCGIFSLYRFELVTGLRSGIRTHKPPLGLPSFIALQTMHYDDP